MIDFDVHEAYIKDREEINRCMYCKADESHIQWRDKSLDLNWYDKIAFCESCGRTWKNDVETFEEWAERKGIDV